MLNRMAVEIEESVHLREASRPNRLHLAALFGLGLASASLYFWGRDLHRFTQWLFAYIGIYLAQLSIYAIAVGLIWRRPKQTPRTRSVFLFAVIAFAAVFRFELAGERPFLSADIYRYIWDGRVQAAGINPYRYSPSSEELKALRDDRIFESIPRNDYWWISPYPPVAQAVFYAVYLVRPSSVGAFKLAMSLFDLLAIFALVAALKKNGQDPSRVVVFAWHPLLIFESAHSGHVDSVYIALISLALVAWCYRKRFFSGSALAAAALVKFYPALLLPAFLGGDGESETTPRPVRAVLFGRDAYKLAAGVITALLLFWLPYSSAGSGMLTFLSSYVVDEGYSHTGSRYFGLELGRAIVPVPTIVFLFVAAVGLALAVILVIRRPKRNVADVASSCATLVGVFLMLTSPRYAWYYAWLLPFLCLAPSIGWLYLASAAALLYLVWYTPLVYPNIPLWLGCSIYLPTLAWLLWERRVTGR